MKKTFVSVGSLCSTRISHKTAFNVFFAFVLVNYRNGLFQRWTPLTLLCSTTLYDDLPIFPELWNQFSSVPHVVALWEAQTPVGARHCGSDVLTGMDVLRVWGGGPISSRMRPCQHLNDIFYRNHWRRAASGSTRHIKYRPSRRYCIQACMSFTTSRRDGGGWGWELNYSWQRHRSAPSDGFIIGFGQVM